MKGVSYFSLKNKWITTGKNNYEKNKTIWSIFLKKKIQMDWIWRNILLWKYSVINEDYICEQNM